MPNKRLSILTVALVALGFGGCGQPDIQMPPYNDPPRYPNSYPVTPYTPPHVCPVANPYDAVCPYCRNRIRINPSNTGSTGEIGKVGVGELPSK